tara:strand:- start:45 stop:581 length:537 start_codon:yes stop_codon:yes gene_type:complete
MKKFHIFILTSFIICLIPVLVSTVNAQTLDVGVHIGDMKDIGESKYKASGVSIIRNAEGELISVVKVDAARYLDDPVVDKFLTVDNPSISLIKKGTLGTDVISHYRVVVEYTNPVCSEILFDNPGFNDVCNWHQPVFSTLFMLEDEGINYTVFRGLNHGFVVKSGYDVTTYWDIFTRD